MPGDATDPKLCGGGWTSLCRGQTKILGIITSIPDPTPQASTTPAPVQLPSFPSAATTELGRRKGGRKEQGRRQAGGEERAIRLLGGLDI